MPGADNVCPIDVELPPDVEPNVKGAAGDAGGFDAEAPNENPVDAGAGDAGCEGAPNGEGLEVELAPKVKLDDAPVGAAGCPNENGVDAAAGAGEGGAGDGEGEPNVNGLGADDAPPKSDFEAVLAAGAPNGDEVESFFSADAPKVKPPVAAGAAGAEEAPNRPLVGVLAAGAADPKVNGAGAEGFAAPVEGSASSSIPLSPSASSVPATEAGAGGARAPKGDAGAEGAGVDSFFSSATGVAGVVPKVKVAFGAEGAEEALGVLADAPKENAGAAVPSAFFGSSAGFEAPNVNGEVVEGAGGADEAGLKENREPVAGAESAFFWREAKEMSETETVISGMRSTHFFGLRSGRSERERGLRSLRSLLRGG